MTIEVTVITMWLVSGASADVGDPPQPNPAEPVNYVAWAAKAFAREGETGACDAYAAAFEEIRPFEGRWDGVLKAPWSGHQAIADWLDENRAGLRMFSDAVRKGPCHPPFPTGAVAENTRLDIYLSMLQQPWRSRFTDGTSGLIAQAYRDGYRDWDVSSRKLVEVALVLIQAGRHLDTAPTWLDRWTGIGTKADGYEALIRALWFSDAPEKLAAEILPRLAEPDPPAPPIAAVLAFERVVLWDFCQRLFAPGRGADVPKLYGHDTPLTRDELQLIDRLGYEAVLRETNVVCDALEKWAAPPGYLSEDQEAEVGSVIARTQVTSLGSFAHAMGWMKIGEQRCAAMSRATRLIAGLFVYRGKHGRFPGELSDLDASRFGPLLIDPFSGNRFGYEDKGSSFLLYSAGLNRTNDGGIDGDPSGLTGDWVLWPVRN